MSESSDLDPVTLTMSRRAARAMLYTKMSAISEDCWCAGWISGNEYSLWKLMQQGGGKYGQGAVSANSAHLLRVLAEALGEWCVWNDAAQYEPFINFLPLAKWEAWLASLKGDGA